MIAIVDYDCGNIFSLRSSLNHIGADAVVTGDSEIIKKAEKIILPGVGAFGDAVEKLRRSGLFELLKAEAANGKYILGICLGMQMLFEKSYEYGVFDGLGLVKGEVRPLNGDIPPELKIPHMGWNKLIIKRDDPVFEGMGSNEYMYFVHSFYACDCEPSVLAFSEYGTSVPAVVKEGNVYGMQFHPEKSGERGLMLLKNFANL